MEKSEHETFEIICAGCLAKTKVSDIKRAGTKYYCPTCYSYIITSLKSKKK